MQNHVKWLSSKMLCRKSKLDVVKRLCGGKGGGKGGLCGGKGGLAPEMISNNDTMMIESVSRFLSSTRARALVPLTTGSCYGLHRSAALTIQSTYLRLFETKKFIHSSLDDDKCDKHCLICHSSEMNSVTGPVSLASVGARNFLMHQTCFNWLSAKCSTGGVCINKILSKLLEESHWFICHICGKDKAIVVCLSTWKTYHLLCVSKSFPQKLNMVNYTLLSDAWDFSEDDELQFSKVFWQNAMRGVFSSQRDNSYDLDYFLELEDKAWLTPTPSANLTTRKKVVLLTFYYIKGYGFVVHGLWIGELDAMGKGGVICLRNYVKADIKKEPLYNYVVGKISELPIDIIEEMKTYWFDKNGKVLDGKYLEFWIRQTLRHGVLEDYFGIIYRLCRPLVVKRSGEDSLFHIIEEVKKTNEVNTCKDLYEAIVKGFGKKVNTCTLYLLYGEDETKMDYPFPSHIPDGIILSL